MLLISLPRIQATVAQHASQAFSVGAGPVCSLYTMSCPSTLVSDCIQRLEFVCTFICLYVLQALTKRGTSISNKLGKPSEAHVRALKTLFPSSSSAPRKRNSLAFDPLDECVFSQEQKKRNGARMKTVQVCVFVVEDYTKGVPRGTARKKLIDNQHLVKVELRRNMTPSQIRATILKEVSHLGISNAFTMLECNGHRLVVAADQQPTGDNVIEIALKRKGAIFYICPEIDKTKTEVGEKRVCFCLYFCCN